MLKIYKIFIIIYIFFSFNLNAIEINYQVSNKYNEIFDKKILSINDVEKYRNIFYLQEECKFKKSDKIIMTLENNILMGHVLSQRYLHPKCYRSKFVELSSWLKMYRDLPQAKRIYRLAIKRKPENYKNPPSPIKSKGIIEDLKNNKKINKKYKSTIKLNKSQQKEKNNLLINIKARVNKGWPTGALKLLQNKNTKNILDHVEIDQQKELIAKGYFLANKNKLALKYANEAIKRSKEHVIFANWTAGLSAWRLKRYKEAGRLFSNFAIGMQHDPWHNSSGAFWAARSYGQIKDYKEINFWLNIAAKNSHTFYGQLSNEILGTKYTIDWKNEKLQSSKEEFFINLPAGKRIMALIQIGLSAEAEDEIIKLNKSVNKSIALVSLRLAKKLGFAKTQLKIAYKLSSLDQDVPIMYFYPIANWIPLNKYMIDKSLVFAFIHQESTFNQNAKSRMGAIGLMQLMPNTAKFISKNKEIKRGNMQLLKNPIINIEHGQLFIQHLLSLKLIDENLIYLATAYNAGSGNLKKWLSEINHEDDSLLFMESIPSRETRTFIERILANYWIYKNQFNENSISLFELAKGQKPIYSYNIN